jgi:hypothetical protein
MGIVGLRAPAVLVLGAVVDEQQLGSLLHGHINEDSDKELLVSF